MCGFRWCGRQLCLRDMPISGVNSTPRPTAVYASDPASPRRPQDSLPSRLLGFERTRLSLASSFQLSSRTPHPALGQDLHAVFGVRRHRQLLNLLVDGCQDRRQKPPLELRRHAASAAGQRATTGGDRRLCASGAGAQRNLLSAPPHVSARARRLKTGRGIPTTLILEPDGTPFACREGLSSCDSKEMIDCS